MAEVERIETNWETDRMRAWLWAMQEAIKDPTLMDVIARYERWKARRSAKPCRPA